MSEPTIDSHIVKLKSSGADVFFNITTPKFAAQAIKKNAEIDWKPVHFLNNVSASIGSVIKPAGFENAQGIISSAYLKDTSDPQWKDDAGMKKFDEFLTKYFPEGNRIDASVMYGYTAAQDHGAGAEAVRRQSHPRERHEAGGQPQEPRARRLLPGIKVNTSPTDFAPISPVQLIALQGRDLGTVRRNPERRGHQLRPNAIRTALRGFTTTPAARCGGFLLRQTDG